MGVAVRDSAGPAEGLMRAVLRDGGSIAEEYPLVFDERFDGRFVVAEEPAGSDVGSGAGTVRSTCAFLVRELVTEAATIRAGLIGSVATERGSRGRGLAGEVLRAAEAELAKAGCVFALLWPDDHTYYANRGYVPFGAESDHIVGPELLPLLPDADGVRALRPSDAPRLHALYSRHPTRVARTAAEMDALLGTPGMQVLVEERAGEVSAYACLGRGPDLAGVVHEWAGHSRGVLALLGAHLRLRLARGVTGALIVMAPGVETELSRSLEAICAPGLHGVLGMGRLVSSSAAAELLRGLVPAGTTVATDASNLRVTGPDGTLVLEPHETLELIGAGRTARDAVERLESATGAEFPALPLAPFVWGLDSI